jgi:hypothetical protein
MWRQAKIEMRQATSNNPRWRLDNIYKVSALRINHITQPVLLREEMKDFTSFTHESRGCYDRLYPILAETSRIVELISRYMKAIVGLRKFSYSSHCSEALYDQVMKAFARLCWRFNMKAACKSEDAFKT